MTLAGRMMDFPLNLSLRTALQLVGAGPRPTSVSRTAPVPPRPELTLSHVLEHPGGRL